MDPIQNQTNSPAPENKSFGPIIGIVVIVIVLIVGALYFWGGAISTTSDSAVDSNLPAVTESDEINAIEQDLSAGTDFEVDFSDIDADLE